MGFWLEKRQRKKLKKSSPGIVWLNTFEKQMSYFLITKKGFFNTHHHTDLEMNNT